MADKFVPGKFKTTPIEDDYEILWDRTLGTGVNGDVVTCVRKVDGEKFALKCLRVRPEAEREITLQFRCGHHPNIVQAYDVYDNVIKRGGKDKRPPTRWYMMVLELLEGGELFDRILEKKSFNEQEASAVMRQIVAAIDHLHKHNIAHRDLKPENLLFKTKAEDSKLKLADFGFAKVDNGDLVTPVYTPYYAPGEILEAQKQMKARIGGISGGNQVFAYDKTCDMWSLGVMLYIILCGYPPFQSEIPGVQLSEGMKKRIKTGNYVFHDKYWKNISDEAKDVVRSLLCTEPQSRPAAHELMRTRWIAGEDVLPNVLMTPGAMKESSKEREIAQRQYEEQLTSMRRRQPMILAPLGKCKNRLTQSRGQGKMTGPAKKPVKAPIDPLRSLISFCIMPPPNASLGALATLTAASLRTHPHDGELQRVLSAHGWDGSCYPESVRLANLGRSLRDLMQQRR